MPVFPGTEPPSLVVPCTIEKDGFQETEIRMWSHVGTHMDAPAHIIAGGATLDSFGVESFGGAAVVVDIGALHKDEIGISDLLAYEELLIESDFLLLRSGWSKSWGQEDYFHGYPVLSGEAARWLATLDLKGIGIDMISIDADGSEDLPVHNILLGNNVLVIENLTNLEELPASGFTFYTLPLKFKDVDGSPVRAIAVI